MNFLHLFNQGGLVMYPLLFCSIIVFAILFERIRTYKKAHCNMDMLVEKLHIPAKNHDWNSVKSVAETAGGMAGNIIFEAAKRENNINVQEQVIENQALVEANSLRRYLNYLETIVTLSPLLGLLGTVTGMISSFSVLSLSEGQPFAITGGVGEALIATATGLSVAIIALIIHSYLVQQQDNIITEIEEASSLYMTAIKENSYEA